VQSDVNCAGTRGIEIATTGDLEGEVMSATQITLNTGAVVNGRLLAQTQVTLAGNTVVQK
jgi:hypothetical protein